MLQTKQELIKQYVFAIQKIYGKHLKQVILYGSYARGNFHQDSDIDIMVLVDLSDTQIDAVLSIEGIAFKRHKDTLAYFNKQYIATEIFPRDMGRKIVKSEEIRHASDYDTFYVASKEITTQQTAEQLLRLAREYYSDITSVKEKV